MRGTCPPVVKIHTIPCSFWENLTKSSVGAPTPGGLAPTSRKSWIRHWQPLENACYVMIIVDHGSTSTIFFRFISVGWLKLWIETIVSVRWGYKNMKSEAGNLKPLVVSSIVLRIHLLPSTGKSYFRTWRHRKVCQEWLVPKKIISFSNRFTLELEPVTLWIRA